MHRIGKRTILIVSVISGIGLAWLIQPFLAPYRAHGRVAVVGSAGAGDLYSHVDGWTQSIIRSRRTPHTGAVSVKLNHPRGREDELEIVVASGDREFSFAAVNALVDVMRETGGDSVQVLDPPVSDRFAAPSTPAVLTGVAVGLLMGLLFTRRLPESAGYPD